MNITSCRKSRGFTLVEMVACIAALLILSATVVHRIQNTRANAQAARYRANVNQLQSAYERAKFACPEVLTNESVNLFAANAARANLLSPPLDSEDLAQIALAPGTSIIGRTALFVLGTPPSNDDQSLPSISFVQPANGLTVVAGRPLSLAADAHSAVGILNVTFSDNGIAVGAISASPYILAVNADVGTHQFTATATAANRKSASANTSITVVPNHAPTVLWNETPSGIYNFGVTVSLAVTAEDTDPGDRVTRVEFYVDSVLLASSGAPFAVPWAGSPGMHQVTAKAYDNNGASATTVPLGIQFVDNSPPTLTLTPSSFVSDSYPDTLNFVANAQDADGTIVSVQFYLDGTLVATDEAAPYTWNWQTVSGSHEIRAVAQDNGGKTVTRTCAAQVGNNRKPTATLTSPTAGAQFWTGDIITLSSAASDTDGSVVSVKFYANGNLIATDSASPFSTTWSPSAGTYSLSAVATDNKGASGTSAPVNVQIKAPETLVWNILQAGTSISAGNFNGSYKGASSTQTISQNGRVEIDVGSTAYWEMGLSSSSDPSTAYGSWIAGINVSGNGYGDMQRCDIKVPGWSQTYSLFIGASDTLVLEVANNQVRIYARMTDGNIRASSAWGSVSGPLYVHLYNNNLSAVYGVSSGAIFR